jgi:hypothetical protein
MMAIMFVCDQLRTEVWHPDFSTSSQVSPTWTRVTCRGVEITNSLEWAYWLENPVQVILCDACGTEACASGGYVHVSRLPRHVLWSAPQAEPDEVLRFLHRLGALAIPIETWNEWSTTIHELPHADRLAPANYAAIADAWILGPARSTDTILAHLQERLQGGDTLEKEPAIALVEQTLTWLRTNAQTSFDRPLVALEEVGARLETLYFDGPAELDWPAFAFTASDPYIVLDREHLVRIEG